MLRQTKRVRTKGKHIKTLIQMFYTTRQRKKMEEMVLFLKLSFKFHAVHKIIETLGYGENQK